MAGSLVLSLSESGPGLATTRIGRCCLLRGATDLQSSAIKWGSKAKGRVVVLKRNVWKLGRRRSSSPTRSHFTQSCRRPGPAPKPKTKTTPNLCSQRLYNSLARHFFIFIFIILITIYIRSQSCSCSTSKTTMAVQSLRSGPPSMHIKSARQPSHTSLLPPLEIQPVPRAMPRPTAAA